MRRRQFITLVGGAAVAWPLAAQAQSETRERVTELVVGAWSFLSATVVHRNGAKSDFWGPTAKGILIFDGDGHFAQIVRRPMSGFQIAKSLALFGSYSIDPTAQLIAIKLVAAPKGAGVVQNRKIISLTENELKYTGQALRLEETLEVAWVRFA